MYSIQTKWCGNLANSMHDTHPILNRLEWGWNVRILPNTYRWNQARFIERISVELPFYKKPKSKALIRPNSMCFWDLSRCDWKVPPFSALVLQTKVIRTNDVKTAPIRCISRIQCWTVWNDVQTFENSRIHVIETKQGLSSEYQSNFTSEVKRKSKPLIRLNSMCF
jgi:hypothetical protein